MNILGFLVGILLWLGILSILLIIFRSDRGVTGTLSCFLKGHDGGELDEDWDIIVKTEKNKYGSCDWMRCKKCGKYFPLGTLD